MFGGFGFRATLDWMTGTLGFPAVIAALGIVVEFVAPLALIVGAAARLASAALVVFMAVAASTHTSNGFFMTGLAHYPGCGELRVSPARDCHGPGNSGAGGRSLVGG